MAISRQVSFRCPDELLIELETTRRLLKLRNLSEVVMRLCRSGIVYEDSRRQKIEQIRNDLLRLEVSFTDISSCFERIICQKCKAKRLSKHFETLKDINKFKNSVRNITKKEQKKGICSACGKRGATDFHHISYSPNIFTELCRPCHMKQHPPEVEE